MTIDLNELESRVLVGDIAAGEMDALIEVVKAGRDVIATEDDMRLALYEHADGTHDRRRFAHIAANKAIARLAYALHPFKAPA